MADVPVTRPRAVSPPAGTAIILLILVLAAILRLRGLSWDEGMMFHPDERNLATAAARLSYPDALVPDFSAYNGLALYLPRLLAGLLSYAGVLPGPGIPDIAWCARLLSASFSLCTVYVVYRTARDLFSDEAACLAAFLAAFSPGLVQAAHFGTTESGLVLVASLLTLISVRHLGRQISNGYAALCYGLVLGAGLGLKTSVAAFSLVPCFAFALAPHGSILKRGAWLTFAGLLSLAILLLTTPQILLTPQAYLDTMAFEGGVVRGTVDVFWTYQFHDATSVLFELRQIPGLLDPVSALLIVPGILLFLWHLIGGKSAARRLFPALATALIYFGLICGWHAKFMRYLIPLLPILILIIADTWNVIWQSWRPALSAAVAAAIVFSMLIYGFMQAGLYLKPDSRILAWQYLLSNMQKGDRLLTEPVDVGAPLAGGEKLSISVGVLPLIEPSGPEKIGALADVLASGQWMVITSRRHHRVLPGMRSRFPEMCNYYDALWSGRLGYELRGKFSRRPQGVLAAIDPAAAMEETYTVFDSPDVFVFRNTRRASREELDRELRASPLQCQGMG